jgi:Protein of unknown function (DUF3073)
MSRGRAKAKQTKVARELKYSSHEPNFHQLQQELSSGSGYDEAGGTGESPDADEDDDASSGDRAHDGVHDDIAHEDAAQRSG